MSKLPNHAFILAAGKGTRMRPITDKLPKPLVEIDGQKLLERTLDKLQGAGVKHVTINLHHLGKQIKTVLHERKTPNITFSQEDELLDTGGGVKNALYTMNGEAFYLLSGDGYWEDGADPALQQMAQAWDPAKMDILLLLQPIENMQLTTAVGDYDVTEDRKAIRSKNKTGAYMFTSIRITKSDIFNGCPEGAFSYLDLMDKAESQGRLYAIIHDGDWHHISTPDDLARVNDAIAQRKCA